MTPGLVWFLLFAGHVLAFCLLAIASSVVDSCSSDMIRRDSHGTAKETQSRADALNHAFTNAMRG
jgi:hypothetical protein